MILDKGFYEEFELDLTGTCNLSCPLCTRNYSHAQHTLVTSQRPLKEIKEQLETFPNLKRAFVAGQVSEPSLYKDFLNYLRYLKSRNLYVELYTNGSTHNPEYWEEVGNILDENDQVHFTICGSTQELHEKYRVGSDLNMLLDNVEGYQRANKNNDYCQFIRFEYNKKDEENVQELDFSHHYTVETEGDRSRNEKEVQPLEGVKPEETRDRTIKWIFENRPEEGEIQCKSILDKKIYITQTGKISACYVHYEYEPNHLFSGEDFDYSSILNFEYSDCFLCEKKTRYKIEKLGLEFIC